MLVAVNLHNLHTYSNNPILAQHALRYRAIIERQEWEVPHYKQLEYDQYDNPAATYLVKLGADGSALGVSRLYPTDRPYMLKDVFAYLSDNPLPSSPTVMEGSRFCVEASLPADIRRQVAMELIIGYLEYGLAKGVEQYVGVMLPIYWSRLFVKPGWGVEYLGESRKLPNGQSVRAGRVMVSHDALERVRDFAAIHQGLLHFSGEGANVDSTAHEAA